MICFRVAEFGRVSSRLVSVTPPPIGIPDGQIILIMRHDSVIAAPARAVMFGDGDGRV